LGRGDGVEETKREVSVGEIEGRYILTTGYGREEGRPAEGDSKKFAYGKITGKRIGSKGKKKKRGKTEKKRIGQRDKKKKGPLSGKGTGRAIINGNYTYLLPWEHGEFERICKIKKKKVNITVTETSSRLGRWKMVIHDGNPNL